MPPIRVATGRLPRILREILATVLSREPEVEVVGHAVSRADLERLLDEQHVDVAIVGLDDESLPELGLELLGEHPSLTVLGMLAEGRHAFLYELRPHCTPLGAVSTAELATVIMEKARGVEILRARA